MIRRGVLTWSLLGALPLAAQVAPAPSATQSTPPATQAAAPDFSAGLQRLAALGLPDLKGAQWIERSSEEGYDENTYRLQKIIEGMKGGAWLITGGDGQLQSLGLGQIQLAQAKPTTTTRRGGLAGAIFGGTKEQARKSCDPKADAAKLIANLANPEKSEDLKSNFRYYGTAGTETLLLFAAQLHQAGHTAEANQLALAVLQFVPNPEAVIDAAVGRFADRDYDVVAGAFFASKDWTAYERGLKQLLEKYPRGWESAPLVQLMLPKVADRASGKPVPALPGADLNADARAALEAIFAGEKSGNSDEKLQAWAKQRGVKLEDIPAEQREHLLEYIEMEGGRSKSGSCWLLESPPEGDSASSRLTRCGMDALPVLLAAMQDETLTLNRNGSSRSRRHISFNTSSEEKLTKRYAAMDRPLARKEMARRWLAPVLPGDLDEASDEAIADSAREFIKQYRGKPKLELLLAYLRDGTESQKALAATALIALNDAAADKAFEDFVMGGDFLSTLEHTRTYLKARKGKARPFFDRYAKAFRDALADVDLEESSGGYQLKQYGGVDKHLKKLELLIGKTSTRDLALKLAAEEKPTPKQIESLAESLAEESVEKLLEIMPEAAAQAKTTAGASEFLNALGRQTEQQESQPKLPLKPSIAEHWNKLLANKSTDLESGTNNFDPYPYSIADHAADVFLGIYDPGFEEKQISYQFLLGAEFNKFAQANVAALLAGKQATWPSAERVKPARMNELMAIAEKSEAKDLYGLFTRLNPDERMAWLEWVSNPEQKEKLPASIKEAKSRIILPQDDPDHTKKDIATVGVSAGDSFDFTSLSKYAANLGKNPKANANLHVSFQPMAGLGIRPVPYRLIREDQQRLRTIVRLQAKPALEGQPDATCALLFYSQNQLFVWMMNLDESEATVEGNQFSAWPLKADGSPATSNAKDKEIVEELIRRVTADDNALEMVLITREDLKQAEAESATLEHSKNNE